MLTTVTLQFPKVFEALKPKKMVTKPYPYYLRGYSADNRDINFLVNFRAINKATIVCYKW